ncbi:sigma factor-binding protein Crl [Vibrio maerlii]|uniref:sigma factor-binding protein Crl n=1 Tax=Vibrio maerlii TaxID=2231648 RepID=UPI000E3BA84E|nr:sigma factor-binding protein Crl [Vibrio maerlii]
MSEKAVPTHFRLLSKLKAIGPYLRENESNETHYLFDCLSVCVDDKKSPEEREFWGWWLELARTETGFDANYSIGCYNQAGDWVEQALPDSAKKEVLRTQESFHSKLEEMLQKEFELSVALHESSSEFV